MIHKYGLVSAMQQYIRNKRWGTCVDCPRTSDGSVYPEFCPNTERYDHLLDTRALSEMLLRND